MRSSDILKNEFLFFNNQKQLDNKLRKGHEKDVKASERYDHFPFTSGDVIDQHRQGLTMELRSDLQNYMMAKEKASPKAIPQNQNHMRNSQNSWASRLEKNSVVTAQSAQLKGIADSCYVMPENNPRVIQDNNPIKNQVLKQAFHDFELKVAQQKSQNK